MPKLQIEINSIKQQSQLRFIFITVPNLVNLTDPRATC